MGRQPEVSYPQGGAAGVWRSAETLGSVVCVKSLFALQWDQCYLLQPSVLFVSGWLRLNIWTVFFLLSNLLNDGCASPVRLALLQNIIFIQRHKGWHVTLVSFSLCSEVYRALEGSRNVLPPHPEPCSNWWLLTKLLKIMWRSSQ